MTSIGVVGASIVLLAPRHALRLIGVRLDIRQA